MSVSAMPSAVYYGGLARVEADDFSLCSPGKYFGRGVYTTTSKEQAERFAKIKKIGSG